MPVRLGVPEGVAGIPFVRRLAWVTGGRVVFLLFALGAVAAVNIRRGFDVGSTTVQIVVATVAVAFALAGFYAAQLRSGRGLVALATAQIVLDQATWTVVVYLTGGAASGATSLYGVTCLLGAFLIGLRGSTLAGLTGIGFYTILTTALYTARIAPPPDQPSEVYAVSGEELAYHLLVNVLVLVVVTLLSSYLADRLRMASGRIVEAEARAESAERLAVLGRLSAGLAHEIRNPLGSIAGSVQLLRTSRALSDEDRQLCEIIQREAARLNDLVTDMMDVARPRKPNPVAVNATQLAREVVDLASKSGRATSDVSIVFSGADALGVRADAGAAPPAHLEPRAERGPGVERRRRGQRQRQRRRRPRGARREGRRRGHRSGSEGATLRRVLHDALPWNRHRPRRRQAHRGRPRIFHRRR